MEVLKYTIEAEVRILFNMTSWPHLLPRGRPGRLRASE